MDEHVEVVQDMEEVKSCVGKKHKVVEMTRKDWMREVKREEERIRERFWHRVCQGCQTIKFC